MSVLWAAYVVANLNSGQFPDELDILRSQDTTPQIQLLLDSSCSMGWDPVQSDCNDYPNRQTAFGSQTFQSQGIWYLSRVDQLKAALTGCQSASDGILDVWEDQVYFSAREFGGSRTGLIAPFSTELGDASEVQNAVMNLPASGGTPLAPAYLESALYFDSFYNNNNTERCRSNYVVVMSDGVGNFFGDVLFDFIEGNNPITVRDARSCFGNFFSGCPSPPYPDEAARYLYETDAGETADALTRVDGDQPIRTYTIGFQAPAAADALLREMAVRGDGQSFSATSYEQLVEAFAEIISNIVAESRVSFNTGTIEASGLFASNFVYTSFFRASDEGPWLGNTKKFCIIPDENNQNCIFNDSSDGLITNTTPQDIWTGSIQSEADTGGTGEVMFRDVFGVSGPTGSIPSNPYAPRTIMTWRPDTFGYVDVTPDTLSNTDTWVSSNCERHALINTLYGYTDELVDCAGGNYSPVSFDTWPIGDAPHSGTILLQYTETCENSGDACFVVTTANDGMLHIYDAINGRETAAIIPNELWRVNTIARHTLADRSDQPAIDLDRRYYFDGALKLHHFDTDADGTINGDEEAYLIAGLGRGGRAYYLIDVTHFNGIPTNADNPIRPLVADEASSLKHLRDTWAKPWTGLYQLPSGDSRVVAVFPSGHIPELDAADAPFAQPAPLAPVSGDNESSNLVLNCEAFGISADICSTPDPSIFCSDFGLTCTPGECRPCELNNAADCQASGLAPPYCYDWPGLNILDGTVDNVWANNPLNIISGPHSYQENGREGIGFRLNFSRFDLQPGDYLAILGPNQEELARLNGSFITSPPASPWIYEEEFYLRFVSDGVNDTPALGYTLSNVEVIRDNPQAPAGDTHRPSIYMADLAKWNQASPLEHPYTSTDPGLFAAANTGTDAEMADGLLARLTSDCSGVSIGQNEVCIDQNTSAETEDLKWMICPISSEPSVFSEGNSLRAIYFGDECGQIWFASVDLNGVWEARRLLRLNNADGNGFVVAGAESKDYRKIFTRLDVVISTCPGRRAFGVYFGTGNLQRPAADNALQNASVAPSGREVVGVVWNTAALPQDASLDDLVEVTDTFSIDPKNSGNEHGWYIELADQERMLRDPLVFDGTAYFDVFKPIVTPTECTSAIGNSRTLAMNNCTVEPLDIQPGETPDQARTVATRENSNIGGGFMLHSRAGQEVIISLGTEGGEKAELPSESSLGFIRLFLWRPYGFVK